MKQADFIKSRQARWDAYTDILESREGAKPAEFATLYRQLCHDVTIAKNRYYSPTLIARLNKMLLDGQKQLYRPPRVNVDVIKSLWLRFFPQALHQQARYVFLAHLLFYGVAAIFFVLVLINPQFIYQNVSFASVSEIDLMYGPDSNVFAEERNSGGDFQMFGFYIYNNISIAFQCFVGGIFLGFGTLYFLLFNAMFFGVVAAYIVNMGFSERFFSFVITHGAFELTAIVLSSAAGLLIGHKLLMPGSLSRPAALKKAGQDAYPIVLLSLLFLILAAFIEAFWSSSSVVGTEIKFVVGSLCWLWVMLYLIKGCKFGHR